MLPSFELCVLGPWETEALSPCACMGNRGPSRDCAKPCLGLAVKPACLAWKDSNAFPNGIECLSLRPRYEGMNVSVPYPWAQHKSKDHTELDKMFFITYAGLSIHMFLVTTILDY